MGLMMSKGQPGIAAWTICTLTACTLFCGTARAERIKDIVEIQGLRGNPLSGVGLVIGLAGGGDVLRVRPEEPPCETIHSRAPSRADAASP